MTCKILIIKPINETSYVFKQNLKKPIFESYEVIKNYIAYEKIKYVLIENYKVLCEVPEEKIRNNLNKRVRIVYSYDYRFDQDIQEEVIYPKILEIENE